MKKVFILIGIFTMFMFNCLVLSAAKTVNLNGTSWELSGIKQNGLNLQIPRDTKITVSFSGNKINGFSGINRYNGTYRIKNSSTLSTNVSTTLMGGPEELANLEIAFLDILQSSPRISYNKNTLTLKNRNGDTLTFSKSSNNNQSGSNSLSNLSKELSGTKWELVSMNGKQMKDVFSPNDDGITISFSGNRISGNSGINNYFCDYIVTAGNVTVGTIGSTKMAGPNNLMKLESQYLEILQDAKKINLTNNKTTLVFTTDKGKILTFEKL